MLGGGEGLFDKLHHLVLPAITLGVVMAAFVMRLTRTSLLEVLRRDYVRTARGKGVAERWVIFKHALRNALIPVTTGIGIYLLTTLSGTITVELVFSRPGLGQLLIGGITARDYTMVQAGLVVFAFFVVAGEPAHRPAVRRDRSADHAAMRRGDERSRRTPGQRRAARDRRVLHRRQHHRLDRHAAGGAAGRAGGRRPLDRAA